MEETLQISKDEIREIRGEFIWKRKGYKSQRISKTMKKDVDYGNLVYIVAKRTNAEILNNLR